MQKKGSLRFKKNANPSGRESDALARQTHSKSQKQQPNRCCHGGGQKLSARKKLGELDTTKNQAGEVGQAANLNDAP